MRRGGTRAARLPARGRGRAPPGCASAPPRGPRGRFLEAANSAWRASQEGRGRWGRAGFRCPASQEKRERGGRRRRRETAGRSTRQRGAGQAPGALDSSWSVTSQATPVSSPGKINPGSSLCTHRVSTAKPLTPRSPGPPAFTLSQVTPSPRGQQDVPFTLAPLRGPASEHLPLPPKPLRTWVVRPWALSAPPSQCSGHTGLSPPCAQVHSLPPRPVSVQHTGIRTSAQ